MPRHVARTGRTHPDRTTPGRYNRRATASHGCTNMKVTIYGSGYVGLVTGACLAQVGNDVLCVDIDPRKIDMLNRGEIPIHEPGLDSLVAENRAAGRLRLTVERYTV